jgi:hypothetical protein
MRFALIFFFFVQSGFCLADGAVAYLPVGPTDAPSYEIVINRRAQDYAIRAALRSCKITTAKDCVVLDIFKSTCVGVGTSATPRIIAVSHGDTEVEASRNASKQCELQGGQCNIVDTACDTWLGTQKAKWDAKPTYENDYAPLLWGVGTIVVALFALIFFILRSYLAKRPTAQRATVTLEPTPVPQRDIKQQVMAQARPASTPKPESKVIKSETFDL